MRILWHMPALREHSDGLSLRAIELARRLIEHGHSVQFCVPSHRASISGDRVADMPIMRLDAPDASPAHWSMQACARNKVARRLVSTMTQPHELFISCQPETIAAYCRSADRTPVIFVSGSTTLLFDAADRLRQRHLSLMRRATFAVDRAFKHRNERAAYHAADAVVFDSEHTRERVIRDYGVRADKCHTIYGGVDTTRFQRATPQERAAARSRLVARPYETMVVGTGRLCTGKGFELMLEALDRCSSPVRGVIVGDGPQRAELEAMAGQLKHARTVLFAGAHADVRPYLHAADAYVFSSRCESFGGALAEAMACGLPCIGLRPDGAGVINANREIIEDGVSGLLCDATPEGLADSIDRLAGDADARRRLSLAARRRVEERFTWDRAGVAFDQLIRHVARESRLTEPRAPACRDAIVTTTTPNNASAFPISQMHTAADQG